MSSVNITPDAARSDRTMRCTPTDSAICNWSNPLSARYEIARSVNSDAKHRRHASSSAARPAHVEVGFLLAGEARVGQVLGGRAAAHGDVDGTPSPSCA